MEKFNDQTEEEIKKAMYLIEKELRRALHIFPEPFNSSHEAYAVLKEEVDELWDEVKGNKLQGSITRQRKEVTQVGAMSAKFLIQVGK